MRSTLIPLALVIVIAVVIGVLVSQPPTVQNPRNTAAVSAPPPAAQVNTGPTTDSHDAGPGLAELQRQLRQEIAARQALETQLSTLRDQVAALRHSNQDSAASLQASSDSDESAADLEPGKNWFNEQALLDAGMNSGEATELKTFYEQLEMDRLRVRDQAIREGWATTSRFGETMQAISDREDSLKDRLDEKSYDAYLYASGQNNRVEVSSVLASSPAATAGLQTGDQILRYDNQRIYDWRELRQATTEGNANETILVEVLRGDEQLQFYIPRGPLGIRMSSVSVAP